MAHEMKYKQAPGWKPEWERPKCLFCGRRLKPKYKRISSEESSKGKVVGVAHYGHDENERFCSLKCGYQFALKVIESQKVAEVNR